MTDKITLVNSATTKAITMDTRTSLFILDEVDWGVVESNHQSYKYINQIGVYVTGTTLETRQITILGWVVGDDYEELRKKKSELNSFVNPKQPIDVFVDEYKIRCFPDSSIRYSANYRENNEVLCRFMISGLCPDPMFQSSIDSRVEGASTIPMFMFPLIIKQPEGILMGLRQPSLIIPLENEGAVQTGVVIEFVASGTVMNPMLINVVTQEYFAIKKTMVAGERITINTNDGSKKIVGELDNEVLNYYQYRDLYSTWLKLEVGTNLFRYDAESNIDSLEVYISFSNRYLEVQ